MSPSRHNRHSSLAGVGERGIAAQTKAKIAIVGCGGLGHPAAAALGCSGVGHIKLIDGDAIQQTNLARLPFAGASDIGKPKAHLLADAISKNNPEQSLTVCETFAGASTLPGLLDDVDIALDATDNWPTRKLIAQTCRNLNIPLISGGALGTDGWVGVFLPNGTPLETWLKQPKQTADTCESSGILSPLVGMIGNMMAMEALKFLWQQQDSAQWSLFESRVFYIDARHGQAFILDL